MQSRKQLLKNSSLSRASSKIIVFSSKGFSELEYFVDFALDHKVDNINFMEVSLLNHNKNSKESFGITSNKNKEEIIKIGAKKFKTDYFQNLKDL